LSLDGKWFFSYTFVCGRLIHDRTPTKCRTEALKNHENMVIWARAEIIARMGGA